MVDKAALGEVFSEYFGFPCQLQFRQFLHHHNHQRRAQYTYSSPWCRVDSILLHPAYLVRMLKVCQKLNFLRKCKYLHAEKLLGSGLNRLVVFFKILFIVRHTLIMQLYGRKLHCFQRDILYEGFGSNRVLRI
jgi:hypothetical protein